MILSKRSSLQERRSEQGLMRNHQMKKRVSKARKEKERAKLEWELPPQVQVSEA